MCTVILILLIADRIIKLYKIELKFLTLLNFTLVYFLSNCKKKTRLDVWINNLG